MRNVLQLLAGDAAGSDSTITRLKAHPGGAQSLGISADGKVLLSGGLDRALRLWEADRLRETLCIRENVGTVEQVVLTPKARWAASCAARHVGEDPFVQLWDLGGGRELRRLRGLTGSVRCLAVAAEKRLVAAGSDDGTIRIWAVDQAGSPALELTGHTAAVTGVIFLHAGERLLSGNHDGTVKVWDAKTGQVKDTRNGHIGAIVALAFGGPSRRLALSGDRVRIRQADGATTVLTGHQGPVPCLTFSADGERVLTGGSDHTVRLWRAADGEELCRLQGHTGEVRAVAFGPDGTVGYSASADGTIRRWPLPH
jgi:WD40 repeat protein